VGEDGVAGLKLGREFPGNVYLRIQREYLSCEIVGIAGAPFKNNEADVRQAFASLPEMLLTWRILPCARSIGMVSIGICATPLVS
jgi:predicted enzyme involved in methoxymalonyl-ACP biosynthesis